MLAIGIGAAVAAAVGGTVLVVGGTIAAIEALANDYNEQMQRIINLREEKLQQLKYQDEQELRRNKEFREVFDLFQREVKKAEKLITW